MNSCYIVLIVILSCLPSGSSTKSETCRLLNFNSPSGSANPVPADDHVAYNKLKPLVGKRFSMTDINKDYSYSVGICRAASDEPAMVAGNVAVIQTELKNNKKEHIIGKYDATQLMSGNDWILLEYWHGESYHTHCNQEDKKAIILIVCDENADDQNPGMRILEEANNKTSDCYYLFEISHKAVCGIRTSSSISFGSITLIILFSVIALYLFLGFLYQRFVLGAKGMQQVPNYSFWQDFGNLQADGCNLVCRSMSSNGSQAYKGIGDEQLEEEIDRDDHLLPM